jgi:hypothetical protein
MKQEKSKASCYERLIACADIFQIESFQGVERKNREHAWIRSCGENIKKHFKSTNKEFIAPRSYEAPWIECRDTISYDGPKRR